MAQNEHGDLIIEIKDFSGSKVYTLEAVRVQVLPENFLKIKETLQRMGIMSRKENTLWQTAHILHKRGFYYIVHFKELFALDGRAVNFTTEDELRRDYIVSLLEKWGLLKISDQRILLEMRQQLDEGKKPSNLFVLPHSKRQSVRLASKYEIGIRH